jgi:hypothetical protein
MCAPRPNFGSLVFLLVVAGFLYFVTRTQGEHIDVGKDGQILIQGHRKLSTYFSLKNKNLIDE